MFCMFVLLLLFLFGKLRCERKKRCRKQQREIRKSLGLFFCCLFGAGGISGLLVGEVSGIERSG